MRVANRIGYPGSSHGKPWGLRGKNLALTRRSSRLKSTVARFKFKKFGGSLVLSEERVVLFDAPRRTLLRLGVSLSGIAWPLSACVVRFNEQSPYRLLC